MTGSPPLRVILGATASGKERLALACARFLNGEIVSVDSMKVYRGLDIATAKAGSSERAAVRHHCLDLVDPEQTFSAADFVVAAEAAIHDVTGRGKIPILSGGSAFYYRALLEGLFPGPKADRGIRARLEERAALEGGGVLHAELAALDSVAAAKIHPADARRVIRALEVAALTGTGISQAQTQWAGFHHSDPQLRSAAFLAAPRHPFIMVRVVRDRDDLRARIKSRLDRMAKSGLESEARMVWERRRDISITPLQAVGYKELFPYFDGKESWSEALEKLRLATNRLIRSQDTWFKKFPAIEVRMAPDADSDKMAEKLVSGVFAAK